MEKSQIIFWCIKLILGGVAAFFAILLLSKTRSFRYVSLVACVLISYCGIIYEMMTALGMIHFEKILIFGIPLLTLLFLILPNIFLIISLIFFVQKKG